MNVQLGQGFPDDDTILDVFVIGAGFAGICAGIKLRAAGISNFLIVDKADGLGGTWHNNTYPGAACDVPSHLYCFSFEPNPDWSCLYSPQAEIKTYIEKCAVKYELAPLIRLNVKIVELRYIDEEGCWQISLDSGSQLRARHIINGTGGLHVPLTPHFEGEAEYKGTSLHTAKWDSEVDFTDKTVAVIGSAASAIQVIPELAKSVRHLTVFQRTPNYIAPRNNHQYSATQKSLFKKWPWLLRFYRWYIFIRMELLLFPAVRKNGRYGRLLRWQILRNLKGHVKDAALQRALTPDYAVGCNRILISDDFYQTLKRDNVTLEPIAVHRFWEDGVIDASGEKHSADIVVYATGYDIEKHMLSIDVIGAGGKKLSDVWGDFPTAYHGSALAEFPNFYMVTGPNTGVGTTSVVFMIEQQIDMIMKLIKAAGSSHVISVRKQAQEEYNEEIHAALAKTVWASGCKSWYRRADGKIITLYPYNARTFRKRQGDVSLKDFEFRNLPSNTDMTNDPI